MTRATSATTRTRILTALGAARALSPRTIIALAAPDERDPWRLGTGTPRGITVLAVLGGLAREGYVVEAGDGRWRLA